jgi:hypothetical protein
MVFNATFTPQSTALEASTLTITLPMNPQSTALEASTLTITPSRRFASKMNKKHTALSEQLYNLIEKL